MAEGVIVDVGVLVAVGTHVGAGPRPQNTSFGWYVFTLPLLSKAQNPTFVSSTTSVGDTSTATFGGWLFPLNPGFLAPDKTDQIAGMTERKRRQGRERQKGRRKAERPLCR